MQNSLAFYQAELAYRREVARQLSQPLRKRGLLHRAQVRGTDTAA